MYLSTEAGGTAPLGALPVDEERRDETHMPRREWYPSLELKQRAAQDSNLQPSVP